MCCFTWSFVTFKSCNDHNINDDWTMNKKDKHFQMMGLLQKNKQQKHQHISSFCSSNSNEFFFSFLIPNNLVLTCLKNTRGNTKLLPILLLSMLIDTIIQF